ncbi:MAG: hypothetical protein E5W76_09285 [Mesorhizobium sp.]|nr:MAG: hypothetical protein E5W76_09285 [Mesorhizobium sp.]
MTDTPTISKQEYQKNRDRLLDDQKSVTARISDACRLVGFGLLAVFYAIKTGDGAFAIGAKADHQCLLMTMGAIGILSVIMDYRQYMFGWMSIKDAKRSRDQLYDDTKFAHKARAFLFEAKQYVVLAGSIVLVWLVLVS